MVSENAEFQLLNIKNTKIKNYNNFFREIKDNYLLMTGNCR